MADETKPVPVSSSALIQVGGTNFSTMRSVEDLNSIQASAPAFHHNVTRALIASGKVRGENIQPEQMQNVKVSNSRLKTFGIGARVKTKTGKKVTIIQASSGYTKKTHTPVHKVADKEGNVWLEREDNLLLIL